ncbi:MAG: radical SAM protein [bacterium]|nr:radical SAM protein [bacterium]
MNMELRPLGARCNLRCRYCYQEPQRHSVTKVGSYDIESIKRVTEAEDRPSTVLGGEPLMLPEKDLENLWAFGLRKFGANSIQTNAVLINDNHIGMFQQYRVAVGISIDGPGERNDLRWAGDLKRTREATSKTHAAIERLCREGIPPGLIVTLHRQNATTDKLPAMHRWIRHLEDLGVRSVRLHLLQVADEAVRQYALNGDEIVAALLGFAELEEELLTLRFDVFSDLRKMLLGHDWNTACVWNVCDPYTTRAVRGIDGNGRRSGCDRTKKEGIDFTIADAEGFERYLALYHTPWEHGGCKNCRFFLQCKGHCPGTAIDGDWRNRTEHCEAWKRLFAHFESKLLAEGLRPLSTRPIRKEVERAFLDAWARGRTTTLAYAVEKIEFRRSETATERLDYTFPDFTRVSWVSDAARTIWEPRLNRIREAWAEIEWLTVAAGIRPCAVTMVSPEDFEVGAGPWAEHGLSALPLEPNLFRIALGTPQHVAQFKKAWDAADQKAIGKLLGYPPCCHEFFRQVWVEQGLVDTTWPMAAATAPPPDGSRSIELAGPPETNILWRWLGARAVFHLPCRFDCEPSVELARKYLHVGREAGYGEEIDWLREILSWPVEWSALHGIAEVKTPVLKVSTRTDATARKYIVRRRGDSFSAQGARGLGFPYQAPMPRRRRRAPGSAPDPRTPFEKSEPRPEWYAADNGFASELAMDEAHKPLVELAVATLSGGGGNVLDLGCGNGVLLRKICRAAPGAVPFGIERESSRVEHARLLHPELAGHFIRGDMFAGNLIWPAERRYALALLMPGRLLEAEPEQAASLRNRLLDRCEHLLVYAYGDWLTRYRSLAGLAREAGLVLLAPTANARVSLAGIG